ncbi:hypothetical protein SDC9_106303 [bioreactor metagenome]|uniref:Uncharacterized protein n=1 Tax=bioreactor metagenome TaxID=1076179 RepID=A0A645B4F5_9ZZZZ
MVDGIDGRRRGMGRFGGIEDCSKEILHVVSVLCFIFAYSKHTGRKSPFFSIFVVAVGSLLEFEVQLDLVPAE